MFSLMRYTAGLILVLLLAEAASASQVPPPRPPRQAFGANGPPLVIEAGPAGGETILVVPRSTYAEWQSADEQINRPYHDWRPMERTAPCGSFRPPEGSLRSIVSGKKAPEWLVPALVLGGLGLSAAVMLVGLLILRGRNRPGGRGLLLLLVPGAALGLTAALWAAAPPALPPQPPKAAVSPVPPPAPVALPLPGVRVVVSDKATTLRLIVPADKLPELAKKRDKAR